MKKLSLILASFAVAALSLNASPYSFLDNNDYYLSVSGNFTTNVDSDVSRNPGGTGDLEFDNGYGVTGAIGRYFHDVRIELELSYRAQDLDNFNNVGLAGDMNYTNLMINMVYEVPLGRYFYFYSGAGIGASWVTLDIGTDDEDTAVFAYQFMTGLGYNLTERLSLYFGYRFFRTMDTDFSNLNGANWDIEASTQHIFEAGLKFDF